MNCPHCNSQVPDGAPKCPVCGQAPYLGNAPEPTGAKCPRCGAVLQNGANFCNICGTSLQQPAYAPRENNCFAEANVMLCPYCRTPLPYGMSVCPRCNGRLNTATVLNDSNGTAIAAFVMALLSLVFPILVIPAIVCGHIGLAHSKKIFGQTGQGLAIAALVIGYITVAIWLLVTLIMIGGCAALMSMAE